MKVTFSKLIRLPVDTLKDGDTYTVILDNDATISMQMLSSGSVRVQSVGPLGTRSSVFQVVSDARAFAKQLVKKSVYSEKLEEEIA